MFKTFSSGFGRARAFNTSEEPDDVELTHLLSLNMVSAAVRDVEVASIAEHAQLLDLPGRPER